MVGNQFWSFLTDNPKALNSIISAIESLITEEFSGFYSRVFECKTQDQLNVYSRDVKLHRIKQKRSVEPNPEIIDQEITAKRNISWVHGEGCVFSARLNKLAENDAPFKCPNCDVEL